MPTPSSAVLQTSWTQHQHTCSCMFVYMCSLWSARSSPRGGCNDCASATHSCQCRDSLLVMYKKLLPPTAQVIHDHSVVHRVQQQPLGW